MNQMTKGFAYGVLSGMTAVGDLYPRKLTPKRYPYSEREDMRSVAEDMWGAVRETNEKAQKTKAA